MFLLHRFFFLVLKNNKTDLRFTKTPFDIRFGIIFCDTNFGGNFLNEILLPSKGAYISFRQGETQQTIAFNFCILSYFQQND